MKKYILVFSLMLMSLPAFAAPAVFEPTHWSEGLHLFAGGGVNSSVYTSQESREDGGLGLNLKTDLLYVLNKDWALEWSANVKFNSVQGYLLWDTLLSIGVRRQIPFASDWNIAGWELGAPYGRVFVGRSPTVLFLNGKRIEQISDPSVSRIHFDGVVGGFGIGSIRKTKAGQIWFTELALSFQALTQESGVSMQGDVPVVVQSGALDNDSRIYSVSWAIGIMAF